MLLLAGSSETPQPAAPRYFVEAKNRETAFQRSLELFIQLAAQPLRLPFVKSEHLGGITFPTAGIGSLKPGPPRTSGSPMQLVRRTKSYVARKATKPMKPPVAHAPAVLDEAAVNGTGLGGSGTVADAALGAMAANTNALTTATRRTLFILFSLLGGVFRGNFCRVTMLLARSNPLGNVTK